MTQEIWISCKGSNLRPNQRIDPNSGRCTMCGSFWPMDPKTGYVVPHFRDDISLILNPAASAANGNSPVYDVCPVGSDKPVGQIALGADDLWRIVGTDGAPSQHAVDLIGRLLSDDTTPDELFG